MKTTLVIGIILLLTGIILFSVEGRPLTSLSKRGEVVSQISIVLGFLLIGMSSVMYLKKN